MFLWQTSGVFLLHKWHFELDLFSLAARGLTFWTAMWMFDWTVHHFGPHWKSQQLSDGLPLNFVQTSVVDDDDDANGDSLRLHSWLRLKRIYESVSSSLIIRTELLLLNKYLQHSHHPHLYWVLISIYQYAKRLGGGVDDQGKQGVKRSSRVI